MTPKLKNARLAGFGLTTSHAKRLIHFYRQVFGNRQLAAGRRSGADFERLMALGSGADSTTISLGDEAVELLQFDRPGRPYPRDAISSDLCFQHFAIVVAEMNSAYQRLSSVSGWTAISTEGPQKLPASSGGVTAFKFRDPDGHPLELLEFPDGKLPAHWKARSELFLGIDHSAISVSDSGQAIAFYESLGLHPAARSLNRGPEQARLDAVSGVRLEVTALTPTQATPHLELLCYHSTQYCGKPELRSNDVAATRLVFEVSGLSAHDSRSCYPLVDPDGHHLVIVPADNGSSEIKSAVNADMSLAFVKPESAQ